MMKTGITRRILLLQSLILLVVVLPFNISQAAIANLSSLSVNNNLEVQRILYQKAIDAFGRHQYQKYNQLKQRLTSYPLYPYLEYKDLRKRQRKSLNGKILQDIKVFLDQYSDSPISSTMRTQLLKKLARRNQWRDFLQFYQPQHAASLECVYLKALYLEGFIEPAFQQVPRLWLVGKSQHKNCDFIFNKYKAAGLLTEKLIWQRIELAMRHNRTQLAKFLAKQLSSNEAKWVKFWIKTHYKPQRLYNSNKLNQRHPRRYKIITHAIKRLARRKPDEAILMLAFIEEKLGLPYENRMSLYKTIGLELARQHHEAAEEWLDKIPDHQLTKSIIIWKIQTGIRNANWPTVIKQIENLPATTQQRIRWQFWWAYAHKQLEHNIEADEILRQLASKRDYYGFLAADILNLPYHFENDPIVVDNQLKQDISSMPGILRARELYHFKQLVKARREWNTALMSFDDEKLLTAARIVYDWGWYDRAIAAIGKTENLNDIEIRFPLAYQDIIENYSSESQIDTSLTYAIIRRESIFIRDAKSEKGALGLMQIMPRTARATARAIKTRYRGKQQLIKTKPNIQLGTQYLKQLLGKHQQQTVLATAAYNAGPYNVKKWLPEDKPMEAIRWIESIPYKETRKYVTNVLAYKIIYQYRMGLTNLNILSQLMPPVPARI